MQLFLHFSLGPDSNLFDEFVSDGLELPTR